MNTDGTRIKAGIYADDNEVKLLHRETTEAVIGAAFEVHGELGYGFLERVYQRSMQVELIRRGCKAGLESPIAVKYKGIIVGEYVADLLVDGCVLVELKTASEYNRQDEAQLLNE